jgi:hypothetical protein
MQSPRRRPRSKALWLSKREADVVGLSSSCLWRPWVLPK